MTRNPLVLRAIAVAVVSGLAAIAARYGVAVSPEVREYLVEGITLAAPLALAMWTRGKVTPLSDPRSADGRPLVPATTPSDLGVTAPGGSVAAPPTPAP